MPIDGSVGSAAREGGDFILKLLLTGASGFTGRHFRSMALNAGYDVVAFKGELTSFEQVFSAVQDIRPDVVLHLGGIGFVADPDSSKFYAVNTIGTANLLDAIAATYFSPKKIVIASSANIYGNCVQSPVSEIEKSNPTNHYANSKVAMENVVNFYKDKLPIIVARPFNYTGPYQSFNFLIPKLVSNLLVEKILLSLEI